MTGSRNSFSSLLSGFLGNSINLYSYAANNPVMLKDPRGRLVPFVTVVGVSFTGVLFGAGTNLAAYIVSQRIANQNISAGGMYVKHIIYKFFTLWSAV